MKIRAEVTPAGEACRLWLDDKEITHNVTEFHIIARAGEPSKIILALAPKEVIISEGTLECMEYSAPDGQVLTEVADANHLWHCVCGTWNHVLNSECRVCKRPSGEGY